MVVLVSSTVCVSRAVWAPCSSAQCKKFGSSLSLHQACTVPSVHVCLMPTRRRFVNFCSAQGDVRFPTSTFVLNLQYQKWYKSYLPLISFHREIFSWWTPSLFKRLVLGSDLHSRQTSNSEPILTHSGLKSLSERHLYGVVVLPFSRRRSSLVVSFLLKDDFHLKRFILPSKII